MKRLPTLTVSEPLLQTRHLIRALVDGQERLTGMVARRDILAGYIESAQGTLRGL